MSVAATVPEGGTLSYQWYRNTSNSATGGTVIDGATNASYTPDTATAGTTYYYCVATNTKNGVTATTTSSVAKVTVNGTPTPAVTISITDANGASATEPKVGYTLTATVTGATDSVTYQWAYSAGETSPYITGATSQTYTLQTTDRGRTIGVFVHYGSGTAQVCESWLTTAVADASTPATPAVTIVYANTDTDVTAPKVGDRLEAKVAGVTDDAQVTYLWVYSDGYTYHALDTGATGATYTVKAADRGKAIGVKVTVDGYSPVVALFNTSVADAASTPSGGSSTSASKPAHDVSVKKVAGGSVTVNQDEARQGAIITVTAAPNSGYALDSLTVLDEDGNELKLNSLGGNKYSFIMPDGEVTVRASFTDGGDTGFVDVPADKYFAEPVAWAVANGITGGTDDTHFSPYASCTRGQLVTFLWRAAGKPAAEGAKGFSDVKVNSSFYQAILWASENGIVGGYADGSFKPNAAVTRQQVAAILYRYAQYAKMDVSVGEDTNILSFNDAFEVSEYAIAAFQWAVGEGVITGNGGNLLPHDTCTRAQIVTMLYRLLAE